MNNSEIINSINRGQCPLTMGRRFSIEEIKEIELVIARRRNNCCSEYENNNLVEFYNTAILTRCSSEVSKHFNQIN